MVVAAVRALVIGGTGPTGPDIVRELVRRSSRVTVLHRGVHEPADPVLREVEHLHADPHFEEPLRDALGARTFDLVVATYGRMRLAVAACAGRCARFVGIGGNPVHAGHLDRRSARPTGMRLLADESGPLAGPTGGPRDSFVARVVAAEQAVLAAHERGAFAATYLRYPMVYGPRCMLGYERGVVRRLRAGRRRLLLPDGGLSAWSRMADRNAAHLVGLVVDHPDDAAGQVYQCADDVQYSLAQWTELLCAGLGVEAELVPVPLEWARPVWGLLPTGPLGSPHTLVDTTKSRLQLGYRDVVAPADALASLVRLLADEPAGDPAGDPAAGLDLAAEDAVLDAYDATAARLAGVLDRTPAEEFAPRWHPYAHPVVPAGREAR